MPNNGANNSATNGRASANNNYNSKSINLKSPEAKSNAATGTASAAAISKAATEVAGRTEVASVKTNHNDGGAGGALHRITAAAAHHRRDNSSSAGLHQPTRRDGRKYQYGRPQTRAPESPSPAAPGPAAPVVAHSSPAEDSACADEGSLVYWEGGVVSGTLPALIQHMVPTATYYPERHYLFAFLLSARLFVRPHELLAEISQTWEHQQAMLEQRQAAAASVDVVDEAQQAAHGVPPLALVSSASPLTQRKGSGASMIGGIGGAGPPSGPAIHQLPALLLDGPRVQRTAMQVSAQNCIRLLSDWIETFPYDFRDERLMQQVRILARKCVYIDNALGKQVSRILQLLVQRLTALEKYEEFLHALANADVSTSYHHHAYAAAATSSSSSSSSSSCHAASSAVAANADHQHQHAYHNPLARGASIGTASAGASAGNSGSGESCRTAGHGSLPLSATLTSAEREASGGDLPPLDIIDMCPSCAQLAHQLTAIELERLSHIGPEEFVQAFAKEYQTSGGTPSAGATASATQLSASLNDMKKTRNLESYVEWFNRLSYFTASEIVKYPKKKQRVRIIEYWIETARECFNIGNFNSLMAIIAGLNLAPISRLKKTWAKVQSAKFSVLEHQMDPTSNFNSYRSTLKAAMWRSEGATDERERIIIPFFSLFVKDLYFLNESCSNRLPNNHINFEKCSQLAKQVMEFNEWKKVSCPYEKLPNVIAFLQTSPVLNENTLSISSFECETPENTEEKGRYKTVKAESKQQLLQQQLQEQQQQHHQQHYHHIFHH